VKINHPTHAMIERSVGSGIVRAQALGDAGAAGTTVVDGGGLVLTEVQVQLIFWGATWGQNPLPTIASVENAVSSILTGPYMSALSQYRGVGGGILISPSVVVTTTSPHNPFSDDDVTLLVRDLLGGTIAGFPIGTVPEPDNNKQIFYCVIAPANVKHQGTPSIAGEHLFFTLSDVNPSGGQQVRAHLAWLTHVGTLSSLTTIFSHELVETCSDPEGTAIQLDAPGFCFHDPNHWCEIGDNCEGTTGVVNGITVQGYWSQQDMACVVPSRFRPTWQHNDLTAATSASGAAGDPAGYTWSVDGTEHVVYRGNDGHIHELWLSLNSGGWQHNDLTAATSASSAAGDPAGYTWSVDGTEHVVYRGNDGHIHELWFELLQ
jgi:hypothetical protein